MVPGIREMLDEEPALVTARSPRLHRCTLLHYCGANGVEGWRQRTPPNAPAVAQLLLDRGADVDATCNLYRGGTTTLGLALTSCHPVKAGLRVPLAEVLLRAGAKLDPLLRAAALGDLDAVRRCLDSLTETSNDLQTRQMQSAFFWACDFGRTAVTALLLDHGASLAAQDNDGQTGLHLATLAGHIDTVKLLLSRGAPLEVQNNWGGTVLGHALWAALNADPHVNYAPVIAALIEAGAHIEPGCLEWWRTVTPLYAASKPHIEAALVAHASRNRPTAPSL